MCKLIFSCIIFSFCILCSASEPVNYSFVPSKHKVLTYTMQPKLSYSMQPKVVKTQPKKEAKQEVKVESKQEIVCDENGCRPANTTYYRYRLFRRR